MTTQEAFMPYEVPPPPANHAGSQAFMLKDLAKSGLTPDDIRAYPIKPHDFTGVEAYVIPYYHNKKMWTTRYNRAENKYMGPKNISDIYLPPGVSLQMLAASPVIWVIEGEKKAAKFFKQFGLPTVGIRGCYGFSTKAYSLDEPLLHPTLVQVLGVHTRLKVVFDADIDTKLDVQRAARRFEKLVRPLYVGFEIYRPPEGKGVDDWLTANPSATVADLVDVPLPPVLETWKRIYQDTGCVMKIDKAGLPVAPQLTEANAAKLIAYAYKDRLYTDTYHGYVMDNEPINDLNLLQNRVLAMLQTETQLPWSPRNIQIGLSLVLADRQTNIVADFMRSLTWDGTPRLNSWTSDIIQTTTPAYANEWGRLLITSMVLRILQPGSRVDYMFTLCGAQGVGKTTFFQNLAVINGRNYYNQLRHVNKGGNSDSLTEEELFKTSVLVDLDEGVYQKRADAEEVKSLITKPKGTARQLYTKTVLEYPRACVFVSTGNKTDMLRDPTGARRFMTITAKAIQLMPEELKYQLFAEVVAHEQQIRQSNWYEINCIDETQQYDLTDFERTLPQQVRHNLQYEQTDPVTEFILQLFGTEMATVKKTGEKFINTSYLNFRLINSSLPGNMTAYSAQRLTTLAASPHFPYHITPHRLRVQQLEFPENMQNMYFDGLAMPPEQLIRGFVIAEK